MGGLYLQVEVNGSKLWRLKYRFLGKEKKLSLGAYPEIGLAQARERQLDARRLLANGVAELSNIKRAIPVRGHSWTSLQSSGLQKVSRPVYFAEFPAFSNSFRRISLAAAPGQVAKPSTLGVLAPAHVLTRAVAAQLR